MIKTEGNKGYFIIPVEAKLHDSTGPYYETIEVRLHRDTLIELLKEIHDE